MKATKEILWVAYYRVSTTDKGQTIDQQREDVTAEAEAEGATIIAEFTDMESGAHEHRPGLRRAIAAAREHSAPIVVAKADRISRDIAHAAKLVFHSGVTFHALNVPSEAMKDELIFGIFFGLAAKERQLIRQRTARKMQLIKEQVTKANQLFADGWSIEAILAECPAAAKIINGGRFAPGAWSLGAPDIKTKKRNTANASAALTKKADTNDNNTETAAELRKYFATHPRNLSAAAKHLTEGGFLTSRGTTKHTAQSVKNLCARFNI